MQARHRWFPHAVILGVVIAAAGCDARPDEALAATVEDRAPESEHAPGCERDDYPCSWAEVPDSIRARSYRVGQVVADFLAVADSIPQVVAMLDSLDGITDVTGGELGIRFRVRGARPIWVSLPNDPAAYRLSGPLSAGAAPAPHAATRAPQASGEPAGVTGRPDSAKRALFLAPFAWESNIWDGGSEKLSTNRIPLDLSLRLGNADLARQISRGEDPGGRRRFSEQPRVVINALEQDANVSLADFKGWDAYSYVFVTTHGQKVSRNRTQMTMLYAGHVTGEVLPNRLDPFLANPLYLESLSEPGVEFMFGRTGLRTSEGFLTMAETRDCLMQEFASRTSQIRDAQGKLRASESAPGRADGPICYTDIDPALQIGLTTEFFRAHYPRGVSNTWIFLMACESMAVGDLGDVFTNQRRNKNVAVVGFDRSVSAIFVRPIAREFSRMVGAGYGIHKIVDSMKTIYVEDNLIGLILGKRGTASAKLTPGISNPSFAPDIVSLLDATSNTELVDGGHVQLAGTAGDGKPDSLRIVRQVALQGDRVAASDVQLRVEVAGRGKGADLVPTLPGNAEHFFRVEPDASDLGFDVKKNERLDLTVVATLPGGGESRWTYRDISFAGCSWSLDVEGSSRNGTYNGSHATYMDLGEKIMVSIGGTGSDGNVITVALPAIPPGGSRTVEVGAKSSGTMAAFGFGDFGNGNPTQMMFFTGDGSAMRGPQGNVVDHQPGPSTITVSRSADGTLTGWLRGRAWAQKSMQDYTLDKPGVELRFTAQEWMSMAVLQGAQGGKMPDMNKLLAEEPC